MESLDHDNPRFDQAKERVLRKKNATRSLRRCEWPGAKGRPARADTDMMRSEGGPQEGETVSFLGSCTRLSPGG